MLAISLQIAAIAIVVGFLIFLARDDMRNQKIREAEEKEDRLALEKAQKEKGENASEGDQ